MKTELRSLATQQIESLDSQVRVVVVHPNYLQQHWLLSTYYSDIALYVRFQDKAKSQQTAKEQFQAELQMQLEGSKIPEKGLIILDETDCVAAAEMAALIAELVQNRPNRIFVFSRQINHETLHDTALAEQLAFVPNDHTFMFWDYSSLDRAASLLEVRSFGEGQVLLNGKPIVNWDGILPRSLFFYIVDRGMTTRNDIFATFWPNLTTREATNVFHVTKRKISEVLGIDLTTYWSGFYRISPEIQLSYDVILFNELLQNSGVASSSDAELQLIRALSLYRGSFLQTINMDWAKTRREELAYDYADALVELGKIYEESDRADQALGLYLRAIGTSLDRDLVLERILQLYRDRKDFGTAIEIYDALIDGKHKPSTQLENLITSIRQQMSQTVF